MSEAKKDAVRKMVNLVDWHNTCPQGSQACNVEIPWNDQQGMTREEELKQDEEFKKLQEKPKNYRPTYKKRKPHYDE